MSHVARGSVVELGGQQRFPPCRVATPPAPGQAGVVAKVDPAPGEAQLALESQKQLIEDLRAEDEGRSQCAAAPSEEALAARRALALLTARERQILVLISQGNSNRCVARELGIAEKTVKNHLSAIFTKVGASDRTQAVVMGIRSGIITISDPLDDASGLIGANE
jgi:DNA-binding CsgD family transcriptional regulator